ncbi:mediator complex subunit kohtalo isoform X2 [Tachypleus tridentatus]|uniref:mediator complex subunit kohtalo isoform X2 n=1 Tax=Tachypleus tridentatus TaxID=6853 RepID=UPI003FD5F7BD
MAYVAAGAWLFEKRPLKRNKLGPPDVYPQDPKQKEDELTAVNVKQGFAINAPLQDEFGSARNANITAAKFGAFFSAILAKKQELNTFHDSGRKKQQINPKDNFWPVTPRSKNAIEAWFKDLAGSKPLTSLAKKVPIFIKKEEIFMNLYENAVPMVRATWFIKMTSAYTVAISEAKMKKRQLPDPSQEWTQALCKFLRELLQKLAEHYHSSISLGGSGSGGSGSSGLNSNSGSGGLTSSTTSAGGGTPLALAMTVEVVYKQWQYTTQLAAHLYEEGLLDRQDFLTWTLELVEKIKIPDDSILQLVLPFVLQFVDEFTNSELLSRRLAYHCAKKLNLLINDYSVSSPRSQSPFILNPSGPTGPAVSPPTQPLVNPLAANLAEIMSCPHHRSIILNLSAMLQIITLDCPSALVWNNIGEGKSHSILNGSPLDLLPCSPSSLPMPPRPYNPQIRQELRQAEQQIRKRSQAAEARWSHDRWHQTAAGTAITRVLNALDSLDRHSFDKVESGNSLDTLYSKVFPQSFSKERTSIGEVLLQDEPVIKLLCEWAVTTNRTGEHRAVVVAKLLEKRQTDFTTEKFGDLEMIDEKDSQDSGGMVPVGLPLYQNLLVDFLDTQAPVIDEKMSQESKIGFSNLVLLFAELIRYDVFSHDAYMCTLISRGSFAEPPGMQPGLLGVLVPGAGRNVTALEPPLTGFIATPSRGFSPGPGSTGGLGFVGSDSTRQQDPLPMFDPVSNRPNTNRHEGSWDAPTDLDDAHIDADLDQILQNIKEGQQNMSDQPDSVGSDRGDDATPLTASTPLGHPPTASAPGVSSDSAAGNGTTSMPSRPENFRHLLYTTHFPLPQDESSSHDCNQRHILLYGVGKARDEARHALKKVSKEIMKLFSKKSCMDMADGGKVKKHTKEGFNFEAVTARFQSLSYFDQHVVTQSCASSVVEMLNGFANGNSNYLPLVEYVSFLFDLMEIALSIHGLIEFCLQLLKELADVETQLVQKGSLLAGTYATSMSLYIVGILYRYHCWLLVSQEQTISAFEGLCKIIKQLNSPTDCTSAERCILCYLYDMYTSCSSYLKSKVPDLFSNMYPKVKQSLYSSHKPSALNLLWNTTYMIEYINNPRMKVDPLQVKQLNDNPPNRYSFVCNAVHAISIARDADRLNEVSILCAELTASCSSLSAEWLGVLKALCCSSNHGCGFIDVLTQVDVGDLSIHDNLAVFTSILVARRCFSLQDFVVHVALPSLLSASPAGNGDQDAESGARLACHLLLRLFRTVDLPQPGSGGVGWMYHSGTSPGPTLTGAPAPRPLFLIKLPCDRHLLCAARNSMQAEPVLAVLKAILVLGDATGHSAEARSKNDHGQSKRELSITDILGNMDDSDFDPLPPTVSRLQGMNFGSSGGGMESAGLNEFARHTLQQICSQDWVHERCLRDPEKLCTQDHLLDPIVSNQQAQLLLHLICHPKRAETTYKPEEMEDQRQAIFKILQNLDQWTLRVSCLELQLMHKQCSPSEASAWLDNVARATIDVFQLTSEEGNQSSSKTSISSGGESKGLSRTEGDKSNRIWLVAPLIAKLEAEVQGRVLRATGQVLESGSWSSSSKNKDKDKQVQKSASLLSHQPFLSLVLMCLKGQDEQREGLLNSLFSQLSQCLHLAKEEKYGAEDLKTKQALQEVLQLRLSLVGGMFDMVQRSNTMMTEWGVLLVQLISFGVIDPQTDSELFTTVLDMMAVLIHTTQVSDASSGERGEETRKQYLNLVKKLKKELSGKITPALHMVRQLLPFPKQQCEVITCEPMGSLIDTKGNKIAGFDSIDKKQGLQVAEKQRVSPWDLLEGHKNPAPLSWSWFGAVRMERKPLRGEETHRLLLWHTHSLKKPFSYFYEPPPLPPEDLEPPPEKPAPIEEPIKRGRDTPSEQSPRAGAKKPKQTRRRRQTKMQTASMRTGINYADPAMYSQGPPQTWYGQQPTPYYSPQQTLTPTGGPRFERPLSQSKAALSTMLRARHPGAQFMPNPGPNSQHQTGPPGHPGAGGPMVGHPGPYQNMDIMQKRAMMVRQQIRSQGMPNDLVLVTNQGAMYPPSMQPTSGQTAPLHHLPPQGMNQGYGSYNGTPIQQTAGMMESRTGTMMQSSYSQSYGTPQGGTAMMGPGPLRSQQGQYMQGGRPQYPMTQAGLQPPNVTAGQMGSVSQMVQGGTPNYGAAAANPGNMTGMGGGPQMQHMLLAMQKQQSQPANLVAQLQRQGPQQHHPGPYHQPGPY